MRDVPALSACLGPAASRVLNTYGGTLRGTVPLSHTDMPLALIGKVFHTPCQERDVARPAAPLRLSALAPTGTGKTDNFQTNRELV